jgi:hypothetical protein
VTARLVVELNDRTVADLQWLKEAEELRMMFAHVLCPFTFRCHVVQSSVYRLQICLAAPTYE